VPRPDPRRSRTSTALKQTHSHAEPEARALEAGEYDRFFVLLHGLAPADWAQPIGCPDWDVRALATTHALGTLRW
jgi:hypothetical protein